MRRRIWLPGLLLALLLCGCGQEAEQEAVPASAAPESPVQTGETVTMEAAQVESTARMPTEEEIRGDYDRAVKLYGWFDLTPLTDSGETRTEDGTVYRRVSQSGYETLDDLRLELRSVFTQSLADRLLSGEEGRIAYRDIDGALYVTGEGRGRTAGRGGVDVEVEQGGAYDFYVNVSVDLVDQEEGIVTGMECWSFPYVLEDGRWGFSEFRLVY